MYFPDPSFIPFVKYVDDKVRLYANDDGIKKHGENLVKVASEAVKCDTSLKTQFEEVLEKKFDCVEGMEEAVNSVFSEFVRKLYNTRLAEFLDSYRQKQTAEKGSATLSGQNTLSQHANLKSTSTL
jgi:hypothetical protein